MTNRLIGIAYAANLFHSGQWSRGYRLLCKIRWEPRTVKDTRLLPRDEFEDARRWAAHYIRRARKESNLF